MNDSPRTVKVRPAAVRAAFGQLAVAVLLSLGGLLFLGALAGKTSGLLAPACPMGPACKMDGGHPAADCPYVKAKPAATSEPAPPPGLASGDEPSLRGKCCCDASGSTTANQVQQALLSGNVTALPPPEPVPVRSVRRQDLPRHQFRDRRVSRAPPVFSRA